MTMITNNIPLMTTIDVIIIGLNAVGLVYMLRGVYAREKLWGFHADRLPLHRVSDKEWPSRHTIRWTVVLTLVLEIIHRTDDILALWCLDRPILWDFVFPDFAVAFLGIVYGLNLLRNTDL